MKTLIGTINNVSDINGIFAAFVLKDGSRIVMELISHEFADEFVDEWVSLRINIPRLAELDDDHGRRFKNCLDYHCQLHPEDVSLERDLSSEDPLVRAGAYYRLFEYGDHLGLQYEPRFEPERQVYRQREDVEKRLRGISLCRHGHVFMNFSPRD